MSAPTTRINGKPCADARYIGMIAPITQRPIEPSGDEMDRLNAHFASLSPERQALLRAEWS